jgi:phage terminase large subunit-like protein
LPYDTIIYSCVKKSGKTTINGAVTLAWGFTQEPPNEILVLANDLEQTLARVFNTMEGIIKFNPELQREAEVQSRTIYLANGTTVTAISGDYYIRAQQAQTTALCPTMSCGAIRVSPASGYGKN